MSDRKTLRNDCVELTVLLEGAHIAPVRFQLNSHQTASPYSIAPWSPEAFPDLPPLLRNLRGDFFCFPLGVSEDVEWPHGETANAVWTVAEEKSDRLVLDLAITQPQGRVRKTIWLEQGHRVLYQEHVISGVKGAFNYGHHPILEFPEKVICPVRVNPFKFGQVYPGQMVTNPDMESSALKQGAFIRHLDEVELAEGGMTSVAEYPARDGYEDIVMISAAESVRLGWTAVSFPGFVWLSLRDTRHFPSTLFWFSNGGRRQPPWNGIHRRRLGVEDICSHFHDGAHYSGQFPLHDDGIATAQVFDPEIPLGLRHAQMVVPVEGQPAVADVRGMESGDGIDIRFENGASISANVHWQWLLESP